MRVRIDFELSPRVKRALRLGVPIAIVLIGGVALAGVPHTFSDGDVLSAQTVNDNFSSLDSRLAKLEALSGGGDGGTATSGFIVWKDSKGALVPVVRHVGGFAGGNAPFPAAYEVYDSASNAVWNYNPAGSPEMGAGNAIVGYVQSGCTGTASLFIPPPARYAFKVATDPNNYYIVPDNATVTQSAALSWQYPNQQCQNSSFGGPAVPVTSLVKVTLPTTAPGSPPYHPEIL